MSEKLIKILLSLLEPGCNKTTAQIVEELRIEHPCLWKELLDEGEKIYGNGCSAMLQPYTRISQALEVLPVHLVQKKAAPSGAVWVKASNPKSK